MVPDCNSHAQTFLLNQSAWAQGSSTASTGTGLQSGQLLFPAAERCVSSAKASIWEGEGRV